MTFSTDQQALLSAPLNKANVASREQGGKKLSYIEAWHAIAEANRIFGFDAWDRQTVDLTLLGSPRTTEDKYGKEQMRVGYSARVRITVRAGDTVIVREGCGFGSGIDRDVDQAHESALKEAESDAMKRALMTFGNAFGLALYDKTQSNVVSGPPPRQEPERAPLTLAERADALVTAMNGATDVAALDKAWALGAKLCGQLDVADPEKLAAITSHYDARRGELDATPFGKAA